MSYRDDSFRGKFADAARVLGATPADIVSLKLRDTVGSYSEYHAFFRTLEHDLETSGAWPAEFCKSAFPGL
jgi:hypothetical protein